MEKNWSANYFYELMYCFFFLRKWFKVPWQGGHSCFYGAFKTSHFADSKSLSTDVTLHHAALTSGGNAGSRLKQNSEFTNANDLQQNLNSDQEAH